MPEEDLSNYHNGSNILPRQSIPLSSKRKYNPWCAKHIRDNKVEYFVNHNNPAYISLIIVGKESGRTKFADEKNYKRCE